MTVETDKGRRMKDEGGSSVLFYSQNNKEDCEAICKFLSRFDYFAIAWTVFFLAVVVVIVVIFFLKHKYYYFKIPNRLPKELTENSFCRLKTFVVVIVQFLHEICS